MGPASPDGEPARGAHELRDADPMVRLSACQHAVVAADREWISPLVATLGDPVKAVVRTACDALVAIEERAGGAAPAVEQALSAPSPGTRFAAAFALGRMRPPDRRLLPALVEALSAEDGDVRWAASRLLVEAGGLDDGIGSHLVALLETSPDPGVRRMLAFALRELGAHSDAGARALLRATDDPDVHVRRAALHALSNLGSPGADVIQRLIAALDDADGGSRRIAALSLGALGERSGEPEPVRRALERARRGDDPDLVRAAERSLANLSPAAPAPAADGDPSR